MKLRIGATTDIGRARQRNEDSFLVREPLVAVADGMGGHKGGEVASALALEALSSMDLAGDGLMEPLVREFRTANRRVYEEGTGDPKLRGMGTTLTALLTEGEKAHLAHVGDSRAYLLRDGAFQQLTEDHTLVQRMVREGRLSPEEAARHPQRSILTRALGVDEDLPVDELTLPIRPGDRLLLCTDGLTGMVAEATIQRILEEEEEPQASADRLVEEANRAGGDDNITVIVVHLSDGEEPARGRTAVGMGPERVDGDSGDTADGAGRDGVARAGEASTASGVPRPTDGLPPAPEAVAATGVQTPIRAPGRERAPDRERERAVEREALVLPPRRFPWRKVLLWLTVLVLLAAGAGFGARLYVERQWYVGVSDDRVAIYNGIPSEVFGLRLSHVEETTDLSAPQAMRLQAWKGLRAGITADDLADARDVVAQIRDDLGGGTPTGGG